MAPPSTPSPVLSPVAAWPEAPEPHRPCLGTILRRTLTSLLVACFIPAGLFYSCFTIWGVWAAIGSVLVWAYGALSFRYLTGRRTSGLLILTALVITGRTLIALLADSTFLYFLQPIITDTVVGVTFLLSLASARPMVARLAGDFYPMDHELHLRPRIQRLFKGLTVMWATLCLGKAVTMFWLLESASLETFVTVQTISVPSLNALAAAATLGAAVLVGRKEGLLGPGAIQVRR
jgi:intracellular septation protein A